MAGESVELTFAPTVSGRKLASATLNGEPLVLDSSEEYTHSFDMPNGTVPVSYTHLIEELLHTAGSGPLWQAVLKEDCKDRNVEEHASFERMKGMWNAMCASDRAYDLSLIHISIR